MRSVLAAFAICVGATCRQDRARSAYVSIRSTARRAYQELRRRLLLAARLSKAKRRARIALIWGATDEESSRHRGWTRAGLNASRARRAALSNVMACERHEVDSGSHRWVDWALPQRMSGVYAILHDADDLSGQDRSQGVVREADVRYGSLNL